MKLIRKSPEILFFINSKDTLKRFFKMLNTFLLPRVFTAMLGHFGALFQIFGGFSQLGLNKSRNLLMT